jgi:hypothetical protein
MTGHNGWWGTSPQESSYFASDGLSIVPPRPGLPFINHQNEPWRIDRGLRALAGRGYLDRSNEIGFSKEIRICFRTTWKSGRAVRSIGRWPMPGAATPSSPCCASTKPVKNNDGWNFVADRRSCGITCLKLPLIRLDADTGGSRICDFPG